MDGAVKWEKSATLDSAEDSMATPIQMEYPGGLTPVHFIRLKLTPAARDWSPKTSTGAASRKTTTAPCAICPR